MSLLRPAQASKWRRHDWILTSSVLTLAFVGSLLVWSATRPRAIAVGTDPQGYLKKHVLTIVLAIGIAWLTSRLDYQLLRAYAPVLYVGSVLGLLAVLVVGARINGHRAWLALPGGFTLQPSEFTKIALIIIISFLLAEPHQPDQGVRTRDLLPVFAIVLVPFALIMKQPDLGSSVVLAMTVLGVLAVGGASRRWFAALLIGIVLLGAVAVAAPNALKGYQKDRLTVFVNPQVDPRGAGYNLAQVRIAIGSGGWTGTGLFKGPQTTGRFVPEQQTDFIYSVAGEELGFLGSGLIIVLLGIIVWRALRISGRAPDAFGRIAAAGVATWVGFQAFENIGMCLGIMPMTGVPLPFISYGGSSLFALAIAIGLLQQIHSSTD